MKNTILIFLLLFSALVFSQEGNKILNDVEVIYKNQQTASFVSIDYGGGIGGSFTGLFCGMVPYDLVVFKESSGKTYKVIIPGGSVFYPGEKVKQVSITIPSNKRISAKRIIKLSFDHGFGSEWDNAISKEIDAYTKNIFFCDGIIIP